MVNLVEDVALTTLLLRRPLDWRVRGVEELALESAAHCTRHRSVQIAPLRDLVGDRCDASITETTLALPIGPMPRGPLMDFSVSTSNGEAWLLPRAAIAQREAAFLISLAVDAALPVSDALSLLLAEMVGFPGGELAPGPSLADQQRYLTDGLGHPVEIAVAQRWSAIGYECGRALGPYLAHPRPPHSSPDRPWLALPGLLAVGEPGWQRAGTRMLLDYLELLRSAKQVATGTSERAALSRELLTALGDYADNFDLMVAATVRLDEPCVIRWSERRASNLERSGRGSQSVVTADCITNHVALKISDPGIRLVSASLQDGLEPAFGAFVARHDGECFAAYAYGEDRSYRCDLVWRLAPLRHLGVSTWLVLGSVLALAVGLMIAPPEDPSTASFIVGPVAVGATLLLTREGSTIGSRLRTHLYYCLMAAIVAVLAVMLYLVVSRS